MHVSDISRWLNDTYVFDNSVRLWLLAIGVALFGFFAVHVVLRELAGRLRARAAAAGHAHGLVPTLLDATSRWLILALTIIGASTVLDLPERAANVLEHAGFGVVALQIALWASALIKLWIGRSADPSKDRHMNPVLAGTLVWGAQLIVWVVLLLAFLANVGVEITAFVASLGVGGVAVALALQNVLGDLFASIAIGLDKPFEVGEFIAFGADSGTVTHVGVKTTRIAALSGEELMIANSKLLEQLIHNYSRMEKRRVVFGFRVPYGTPADKVETIARRVRAFVESESPTAFDRAHLVKFGEHGLEFEVVYYVLDPSYNLYCDIQQAISLRVMGLLEELGVAFAVPERAIRLDGDPSLISDRRRNASAAAAAYRS